MSITAYRWMMNGVNEPLTRQDFIAQPGENEVVVEVAGCGVCHTDLGFYYDGVRTNSELPLALGHEISGRVVAAGDGAGDWLNKAVIIPAVIPCGECELCKRGKGTICRSQKMPGNEVQTLTVDASGMTWANMDQFTIGAALAEIGRHQSVVTRRVGEGLGSELEPCAC